MTEDPRQTLSALLDGECSRRQMHRAITSLLADEDHRQCWERYLLFGRVLRGEPVSRAARRVAPGVRAALAATVRELPPQPSAGLQTRLFAPLAAALAAGVALLAVLIGPTGPFDVSNSAGRSMGNPGFAGVQGEPRWQRADPLLRTKLDQLLVNHHERAPAPGLPGFVAYASVVGYEGRP